MKIIVLADIHGCLDYLPGIVRELADADLVLLAERLAEIKPALREAGAFVFLTHQPPAGTKVDGVEGRHTGSTAIREFILDMRPILAVSGHMHEAFGTDMLGGTLLVNPGPFRHGRYAVIELEDGRVRSTSLFPRE